MTKKNETTIRNTTKEVQENPLLGLIHAIPGGGGVEAMEARGQRELVGQTTKLPTKGSEDPAWAKMDVIFGSPIEGDALFRNAMLPLGWKLEAQADHAMHNKLLDGQGRERGHIFYKAAFYDRRADIRPVRRYRVTSEYKDAANYQGDQRGVVQDTATGKVLFVGEWVDTTPSPGNYQKYNDDQKKIYDPPTEWLKANKPDYENAAAYWDE